MELSNIKHIKYVDGIEILLKSNPNKFVIMGITLETTPDDMKIFIRKWLKILSKKFPNILFLYFCASKDDLGKFTILSEDILKYPMIIHIYNINNICCLVTNADPNSINDAFLKMKDYYLKDLEKFSNISGGVDDEI